ncbi:hypothetical protein AGMMS49959_12730 [Planctomycetales bacterium]|nr:hypothetical protein AGMMS49959_12730 [Planctomycetales bacterium]
MKFSIWQWLNAASIALCAGGSATGWADDGKPPPLTAEAFIAENHALLPEPVRMPRMSIKPVAPLRDASPRVAPRPAKTAPAPRPAEKAPPPPNNRPLVTLPDNLTVEIGKENRLSASATDLDADELTYRWRQLSGAALPMRGDDKDLLIMPLVEGVYILELIASDGKNDSEPAVCAVTALAEDF